MSDEGAVAKGKPPGCGNCGKPAILLLDNHPVCIDCNYKFASAQWMQWAKAAAMLNHSLAEMDDMMPFGPPSAKVEIPKHPMPPINYNNQSVTMTGGNVGAINFGNVHEIQVNLQSLVETGSPDLAEPLGKLADAVLNAQDADDATKNELLEQISTLTALANEKAEVRKPGVIKALLSGIGQGAAAMKGAADAWNAVEPLLRGHFFGA